MQTRRIISSPEVIRESIHRKVIAALQQKFPITAGKVTVEISNVNIQKKSLSHSQQKDFILAKSSPTEGVYADLTVKDTSSGKLVASLKNHRVLSIPYFTNRYTLPIDGNEYAIVNQMRTKPGVYTRVRGNEELESSFNLRKGANFKLLMDPETGTFKVNMLGATLPMYCVLKVLGAPDSEIRAALGPELYATNSTLSAAQMQRTRDTLYKKLVINRSLGATASDAEKDQKIREYFMGTEIDPETTKITLGKSFYRVNYDTVLLAAKKMLEVFKGTEDIDERDNLEFQQVHSVEDLLAEALIKNRDAVLKITTKLKSFTPSSNQKENEQAIKSIFSPVHFTKPVRNFVTTSNISRLPGQINPLEILDATATITRLGEGAISSEQAVPDDTRAVNYSYLGVIDPVATPESSKVGIDTKVTISARKGDDNEFYREVRNVSTGKVETKRLMDLYDEYVSFPEPVGRVKKPTDKVAAVHRGKLVKIPRSKVTFETPSVHDLNTVTTSTLPFINANQANRTVMGAKHVQQALPLVDPDTRLVRSSLRDVNQDSTAQIVGDFLVPKAPVAGVASSITKDYIVIKDSSGRLHEVDYADHLPLASKTFLHNNLIVKVGDKVTKGQPLAGSNFSKDGQLAVGKNLTVAYMPYHGMNHEDGIVISESTASKMSSVHSEKITTYIDKTRVLDKAKFSSAFPMEFSRKQLAKLDASGVAKPGVVLEYGDPVILILEDNKESRTNQVLGNLHKGLIRPYRDASERYEHHEPATVLDAKVTGRNVVVLLEIVKKAKVGDKLAGSFGNKGVISSILPDDHMPKDEEGTPVDAIFTSLSVISRINPGQILESALGKVARKTGAPYAVENFSHDDYIGFVKKELKKHGVKDKETVTDPITGKKIPGVFVGVQHVHKLFKTTDSNYAARGVEGAYDQDDTPSGSGETGPKAMGGMEVNALIAHNARSILKESSALRSSRNTEFWNAFKSGRVAHFPTEKKTFNRFTDTLRQAGVKVVRDGDHLVASPLTDNDIKKMSSGEITNGSRLQAKDLSPEQGGLFDEVVTGGMNGDRWGHVTLAEPVINPVFAPAVQLLLDKSAKDLQAEYLELGGKHIRNQLNALDVDAEIKKTERQLNTLNGAALDKAVKRYKYLKGLKVQNLKPGEAYTLSVVPVTPPKVRPVTVSKLGDLLEADANLLYKDLILQNNSFKDIRKSDITDKEELKRNRKDLYRRVEELVGTIEPESAQLRGKGVKGALQFIAGDVPKRGYFQRKVVYSKMNTSGRATLVPDKNIGLDEVGLPEDAAWEMYAPFVIRKMVQSGHSAMSARDAVANRTAAARDILLEELANRPVLINRAPTLWRHSMVAAKPVLKSGKNLHVNTLWENATNQDYDGDASQIHVPVTDEAVQEAYNLLPSKQVFSDKKPGDLLMAPTKEPIVGLYTATRNLGGPASGSVKRFKTEQEAWAAYHAGTLKMTDLVSIAE